MLDTTPAFEDFARKAFMESPFRRDQLWHEHYEGAHPEAFAAFHASQHDDEAKPLVRELSDLRKLARAAAPVMRQIIDDVDPKVQELLGLAAEPSPLHVLIVGSSSVSAVVGRMGDDVALFHCLEWFKSAEGAEVLVAHEDTHAWHELALGGPPPTADLAWTAFSEGLAVRASRQVVAGRPDDDYFWYGYGGFEQWLPWCQERRDDLVKRFRAALDEPGAVETFFGAGLVDGQWRVGFYVADILVSAMKSSVAELAAMSAEDACGALRASLDGA